MSMRCNLPYIIPHHRFTAGEDYDKTRKCLCHIVKKCQTLFCLKLIGIWPEPCRCPAMDAVQIARPRYLPCNELGKPFLFCGWFSFYPRHLVGMTFWHCMHNYLPSYSILKILLPRFALKNVPDTRRSKASREAYFCSMLSEEAAATTQQMAFFSVNPVSSLPLLQNKLISNPPLPSLLKSGSPSLPFLHPSSRAD